METITDFREIRGDGRVIDEQMTLDRMAELGWESHRVVAVQWEFGDRHIELKYPDGVLARILQSRDAVVLKPLDGHNLEVINADGTERLQIANEQFIDGKRWVGVFSWFENVVGDSPYVFYVVFETRPDYRLFLLEIDSRTGKLLNARPTR